MNQSEGVIKFNLDFTAAPARDFAQFNTLNAWRNRLKQLGLIGRDASRYQGDAYGNVSCRAQPGAPSFYISATQTGDLDTLTQQHYTLVENCDIDRNSIVAVGPAQPSSEALTHCAVYTAMSVMNYVFHVHSPEIWQLSHTLNIAATDRDIAYGTVAMAQEIRRLAAASETVDRRILCMLGHEDGVISYGKTAEEAGNTILNYLSLARMHRSLPG